MSFQKKIYLTLSKIWDWYIKSANERVNYTTADAPLRSRLSPPHDPDMTVSTLESA